MEGFECDDDMEEKRRKKALHIIVSGCVDWKIPTFIVIWID